MVEFGNSIAPPQNKGRNSTILMRTLPEGRARCHFEKNSSRPIFRVSPSSMISATPLLRERPHCCENAKPGTGVVITAPAITMGGAFFEATTHLGEFTFFAATAARLARRGIFITTNTQRGGFGTPTKITTFRIIRIHLGPRKLLAGRHIHIPRTQHTRRYPSLVTAFFGFTRRIYGGAPWV